MTFDRDNFDKANHAAVEHLMRGATLDDLKAAASDLRALTQSSALADLVDAKIKRILSKTKHDRQAECAAPQNA